MNSTWMNLTKSPVDKCGWPMVGSADNFDMSAFKYLDLLSYPILLSLCTFGNVLNIIILTREKPGGSKNCYLIAIAILDLIYMWSALTTYVVNYEFEVNGSISVEMRQSFDAVIGLLMFLQEVAVLSSAWIIVAFSADRFLAIVRPMKFLSSSGGHRRNTFIILIILAFGTSMASNRLVDYYWVYANYLSVIPKPKFRTPRPHALMAWYTFYIWFQAASQVATFMTILILNLFILQALIRQRSHRQSHLRATTSQPRDNIRTPLSMLTACVLLYLITQLPLFIHNIFYLLEKTCLSHINTIIRPFITPIENVMINIYFSINFVLYCGVSRKFRRRLRTLCDVMFGGNVRHGGSSGVAATSSATRDFKVFGSTKNLS